ncbi:MAG: beta-N-acetylhexosaminidase [Planctomycetota bacterium]|nr:beta-N-acetylhexosaminidase [Planctomycetota bacterium]
MALSLLPQPKSVKVLVGHFDFKEVDTVFLARRASPRAKQAALLLCEELKRTYHLDYEIKPSSTVKDPQGCLITHHSREGIFVRTALAKPHAYELLAAGHALTVSAVDDEGLVCALQTVRQLLQEGTRIPALKIEDWPTVPFRVLHVDLKGLTPDLPSLREIVERAAFHKYSALLVEYEDRFPYACLPELRGPNALTPETLEEFVAYAERNGLETIPLVQTLGHLEFLLRHPKYRELAEVPEIPQQISTTHPKALKLLKEMVKEILEAHPNSRYIHLGADEAWQLGKSAESRAAVEKAGSKEAHFIDHVTKFVRQVKLREKTPLIWDDMLREAPPEVLKRLPKTCGLVYWRYDADGGQYKPEMLPQLGKYLHGGYKVFGACAIRGAEQFFGNIPNYRKRMDNVDWWVEACETQGRLAGLIATSWSRFNSNLTPCDPMPAAWPSILYGAERMWTGLGSSRESFERRLLVGFYGLRADAQEVALAHYGVGDHHAKEAVEVFGRAKRSARRNRDVLELLELLGSLEVLNERRKEETERLAAILPKLEAGTADPSAVNKLRAELPQAFREVERLEKELSRALSKRFHKQEVDEFILDRLLLCTRFLEYLQLLTQRS